MSWEQIYSKTKELTDRGLKGEALVDELKKWAKETAPLKDMTVHDFFNVSKEEEASWYDNHIVFKSFEEFTEYITENGLDVTVGFQRNALRQMSEEGTDFIASYLDRMADFCETNTFNDSRMLSDETLTFFKSVCFFAAENHIESFFKPVLTCLRTLHTDDYQPLKMFIQQCLPSILYAICDGDFTFVLNTLFDPELHPDIREKLAMMLRQFALDGVFPDDIHTDMLKKYIDFIVQHHEEGLVAAEWLALVDPESIPRKVLKKLLKFHVDFAYYGTTDSKEFTRQVRSGPERLNNYVMDDMILLGTYTPVLHPPEGLREKVTSAQKDRIERFRLANH